MLTDRLSSPLEKMKPHYTVVVVGSGYGGSIAASRLSRAGQDVCVLERGREIRPGEYPDTNWEAAREFQMDLPGRRVGSRTGLYDLRGNEDINVFMGCGLGGTSLVNANVSLRPDRRVFDDPRWPAAVRADVEGELAEAFSRAEAMLRPTPYPEDAPILKKLQALERSAQGMGARFYRPPINVTFRDGVNHVGVEQKACTRCGNCCSGCNYGAKNTLLMNYLPDARNHGAEIFTQVSVRSVERQEGRWVVHYQALDSGRERFDAPTLFVTADLLILAAGALGSTEILLRSREAGLAVSPRLGEGFTGNGDVLGFGYGGRDAINGIGWGPQQPDVDPDVGPTITGIIDLRDHDDLEAGMVIEEGAIPGFLADILPGALAVASRIGGMEPDQVTADDAVDDQERDSIVRGPRRGSIHNTQTFLVMAHDDGAGRMYLEDDRLRIAWPAVGEQPVFARVDEALVRAVEPLGGSFVRNPTWSRSRGWDLVTVHPLGGCVMGEDAERGVVDDRGRAFSNATGSDVHDGLFVWDGSILPRPLGVNPLITISALAERAAALVARDRGWTIDYSMTSVAAENNHAPEGARPKMTLRFTERMAGFLSTRMTDDFEAADRQGKVDGSTCEFLLTIRSEDLEAMLADPAGNAAMSGTVTAPALSSSPLVVSDAVFQLFGTTGNRNEREMRYKMTLSSEEGRTFRFDGFKAVHDDPGLDLWADTTTLFITVREDDDNGPVVGRGVLRIAIPDFIRQLTTITVEGAPSVALRLEAQARFGRLFAGELFRVYGGIARRTAGGRDRALDPDVAPRKRRPLRAPAPTVHAFDTEDGVRLRLTRYRGGPKGPVVVAHGMAVSSRTFSLDTIETNVVEFLTAHGYDVWLFDWRASIDLPSSRTNFTADQVALFDWPAAIRTVQELSGAGTVQVASHCVGSITLFMALLAGLDGVRSVVTSQIGAHMIVPTAGRLKAVLYLPNVLDRLGVESMTAEVDKHPDWLDRLWNRALQLQPIEEEEQCNSSVCHRLTFLFGLLWEHDRLNDATHSTLGEQCGVGNIDLFEQLALIARRKHLVMADGTDSYLPNVGRLAFPITFLHGAENVVFEPDGTEQSLRWLSDANGSEFYARHVLEGYGHLDPIIGREAARDVYPLIVQHLEAT
ncbi:alpha/beta fold hydrolase [soil metagenome]